MTKHVNPWQAVSLLLISALAAGCARRLDTEKIAANIQSELEQAGNLSIQTVTCPEAIALEPEAEFRCLGELASGNPFIIDVTQTEQLGQVKWTVPSSKGLLNLRDLEKHFQTALAAETVSVPVVNCGGNYRPNQAGDRFDCRVINGLLNDQTKIEKITVTVDAQQDVSWQQMRQQLAPNAASNMSASPQGAPSVTPTSLASPF
jgi:hypothetical protein